MGYGDSSFAGLGLVGLSSVAPPAGEMGICAADLALGLLQQAPDLVRKITLEPQFVRRDSTASPDSAAAGDAVS